MGKEKSMSGQINHYKDFTKLIETLGRKYDYAQIFEDFLSMSIHTFHRTNIQSNFFVKDEENEKRYLEIVGCYDPDEVQQFPKLLGALMQKIYDDPYSDMLGQYFTEFITRGQNGQFFTPIHLCDLMAQMTIPKDTENKRINDPACGSGRTLLSAAKINHRNYFYGADVSAVCSKMSVLNFYLNGLQGEIAHMNSLSMEWFQGWHINTSGLGIVPITKEQSVIWSKPPEKAPEQGTQLTFF